MLKEDGKSQFGRLPYLTDDVIVYYLDLLVYRAKARLNKIPLFFAFLQAIQLHTIDPLLNFDQKVPLAHLLLQDDDVEDGNED